MKGTLCCWLTPAAFFVDRATKAWALGALESGAQRDLWPGVLRLVLVRNTGAAFGVLHGHTALLTALTAVLLAALLAGLLLRRRSIPAFPRATLWLLFWGATGNLYDRIVYGYVIDFLEIELFAFPVFNVADACVCVAFALLVVWILFGWKEKAGDGAGEA